MVTEKWWLCTSCLGPQLIFICLQTQTWQSAPPSKHQALRTLKVKLSSQELKMEGDLYPVLLLTHFFFSKWTLASETINSMVNEASFCTMGLDPIKVLNPVSMPTFYSVSLLITTHLQTQPNMEAQKGMKRSGLIPPRMPNKWKPITKPWYQTENK